MKPLETSVERRFVYLLDKHGITHLKFNMRGRRDWPDRGVFLPGGNLVFVELKRPGEEPHPSQLRKHDELRRLGYPVIVEDNADRAYLLVLQHGGIPR